MAGYDINWNALNVPDIGGAFTQGYDKGRTKATLGALSRYPNDGQAMNALMSVNPEAGFQFQDRQIKLQQGQREQVKAQQGRQDAMLKRRALAAKGAKDAATWDTVAQQLVALGDTDAAQAIGKFTPEYRAAVMASGGVEDDDAKPTDMQRKYEWLKANHPEMADQFLQNEVDPTKFITVENADGSKTLLPTRGGAAGGSPQGQPQPGGNAPRSVRNGNPGNIEDGPFARSQPGYQGGDGRFARFAPGAGAQAQTALLQSYVRRGFNTPAKIINRWAPAGDGNNNPTAYAQTVAQALGIGVNDPVRPDQIPALAAAIARVEGGPQSASNGPAPSAGGIQISPPKPKAARMSAQEVAAEGLPPGVYYRDTNGMPQKVDGQPNVNLKPVPAAAAKDYVENNSSLRKIHEALGAIDKNPGALGAQNYAPDFAMQRLDPDGVDVRAKVSDVGSLLIHDRSGAAVTISETPRLKPFVPSSTDTPETARKKLRNLAKALEDTQADIGSIYAEDQGYKGLPAVPKFDQPKAPPARIKGDADYNALPSGAHFIGPDGHMRVKP